MLQIFVMNSYTEFQENVINGWEAVTTSQTKNRRTDVAST